MPNLEWNTINRLSDNDLAGGLVSHISGLGALGKGSNWPAINAAGQAKAAELSRTVPNSLVKLDAQIAQIQSAYDQVQSLASAAADLASQSSSTAPLSLIDRFNAIQTTIEDQMAQAQAAYDKIGSLPRTITANEPWVGDIHDVVHNQWPAAERAVAAAVAAVRGAAGTVPRMVAQAQGIYKQIQAVVSREQQTAAAAEAREAQKQALIQARENQALQIEQAKLAQQLQIEQARAQAELQRELALNAPLQMPSLPAPSYGTAPGTSYGMPPAPPGYMYVDPTTQQPVGQQPTYATQQFQLPQGYGYSEYSAAPQVPQGYGYSNFTAPPPLPQPAPAALPQGQNWFNVEYDALIAGESQYLRGMRGLGAVNTRQYIPRTGDYVSLEDAKIAAAGGPAVVRTAAPTKSSSFFSVDDAKALIGAAGAAAPGILSAFGFNVPQQVAQQEAPRREIPWGTVAAVGVAGAVVLGGLALLARGGKKSSRGRGRR